MPSCHPYEVRARGSERSRRVRFGTGPGSLEKVAVFGSRFLKTQASKAAASPAGKACQMASRTQTEDGSLLRVPQEVPAAHMTASLGPPGSHLVRVAGWHLELAVGGQGRDEDFTASGRPPMGG